jgi:DNA-binding MarR family transcriptional regulator
MPTSRSELLQEIFSTTFLTKRLMHTRLQQSDGQVDVSPAQIDLLLCMRHMPPVSFKELACRMHLTPGAVTQLTDPLTRAGYVSRVPDDQDRRMAYISLTEAGVEKMTKLGKTYQTILSEVLSSLDIQELEMYLRVQRKMLAYLEAHANEPSVRKVDKP